ncbi:MAG: hypothetical protein H6598_10240 [Flavobacteriales bacterium]|nr:hypothetical protein [Flavobacteriales bacterium]
MKLTRVESSNKAKNSNKPLLLRWLKFPKEIGVQFGGKIREGSILINLDSIYHWKMYVPLKDKIRHLLFRKWIPNDEMIKINAIEYLQEEFLGEEDDFGLCLYELLEWHYSLEVQLNDLTERDKKMFTGLESSGWIYRQQFRAVKTYPTLNLELALRNPLICLLISPMVIKIPVRSVKNFLDIDAPFAFDRIRKSKHELADDIIYYLYEILLIQQKTADDLKKYLELIINSHNKKGDNLLTYSELEAIRIADRLVPYLKATVEKSMQLLALSHGFSVDGQKKHRTRLNALETKLPDIVKEQFYCSFVLEQMSTESIEELNNIRTAMLHKRGSSNLQPHSIVNNKESNSLLENWLFVKEYHAKNTLMLIAILSSLTDELVRLDPPSKAHASVPVGCSIWFTKKYLKEEQNESN